MSSYDPSESKFLKIPWLGFEIELRSDLLALAAFVLALTSASYQLVAYLRGFNVDLFPPPQVLLNFEDYGEDLKILRIGARMAYVNRGEIGYNAAISEESVTFRLQGQEFEQKWQAFQQFDRKGRQLIPHYKSDAYPFPVNAGSAVSHETYFASHPVRCQRDSCDKWQNLIERAEFLSEIAEMSSLKFNFRADIYGGTPVFADCRIELDEDLIANLAIQGWDAPRCWSD